MNDAKDMPFASRAGQKLDVALRVMGIDVSGFVVADFGSHAGGFVDCLLRRGAARVYAIEPGYGVLDYRLRRDARVVVCERQNALHFVVPEACDLVTIDVGWTRQRVILPAARRALKPGGCVVSLVKPHYEAERSLLRKGVLPPERLADVLSSVRGDVAGLGWTIGAEVESPIQGHGGNSEVVWLLRTPEPTLPV